MAATDSSLSEADPPPPQGPVKVVILYAAPDRDLLGELEPHLSVLECHGRITIWHRDRAAAGEDVEVIARRQIEAAEIIVPLISVSLLACHLEMNRATEAQRTGRARIVPVLVRPCDLAAASVGGLQMLPRGGPAVSLWGVRDAAWTEVATAIRETAQTIRSPRPYSISLPGEPQPPPPVSGTPLMAEVAGPRRSIRLRWGSFALAITWVVLIVLWRLFLWHPGEHDRKMPEPVLGPADFSAPVDMGVPLGDMEDQEDAPEDLPRTSDMKRRPFRPLDMRRPPSDLSVTATPAIPDQGVPSKTEFDRCFEGCRGDPVICMNMCERRADKEGNNKTHTASSCERACEEEFYQARPSNRDIFNLQACMESCKRKR